MRPANMVDLNKEHSGKLFSYSNFSINTPLANVVSFSTGFGTFD